MVYVKMVNIVTLMASLGIIKKRVYAIRKLKCMDKSLKKLGRSIFKFARVTYQLENLFKTIKNILLLL